MAHPFAEIAFTSSEKAAQQRDGSRSACARSFEAETDLINDRLGPEEVLVERDRRIAELTARLATLTPATASASPPT